MDLEFWLSVIALTISVIFSIFTLIRNLFQAETSSWNTALTRVGQLYDKAYENNELTEILREPPDPKGEKPIPAFKATPKQDVWLANLFMAYEQIYVAISGARGDSKRAWKTYLKNQLNKPIIRFAFIHDAHDCDDYHRRFISFCFGKRKKKGDYPYTGKAINKKIIKKVLEAASAG